MIAALLLVQALAGGAQPGPGDARGKVQALLAGLGACGPTVAARWNEIEGRFEAWLPEACRLAPDAGRCVAAALDERVTFARALPALLPGCPRPGKDGAAAAWQALLLARRPMGADVRLQLARRLAQLAAQPGAAELRGRIDAAWNGAIELAARQCGLLAGKTACAAQLEEYLFSLLLGGTHRGV